MSHTIGVLLVSLDRIHSQDHQLARRAQFGRNNSLLIRQGAAVNHVLPLARVAVFLPLHNLSCQDTVFNVENREFVIFHFFFGMHRHHILTGTHFLPHAFQGAVKHDTLRQSILSWLTDSLLSPSAFFPRLNCLTASLVGWKEGNECQRWVSFGSTQPTLLSSKKFPMQEYLGKLSANTNNRSEAK